MQNKSKISKWEPVDNIPARLYLEGLHDDYEGLRLLLKGENATDRVLRIQFSSHLGYRNVDESNRLKTLHDNPILTTPWSLFVAIDDGFLEWVVNESLETMDERKQYKNYIICTPNDIVDVISDELPIVKWV
ncbi:MAG: hypothetical protein JWR54_2173 [Mucilaginibacter sp.]|nr:hypothetical protein [Mucilaginibacter sp.]